MLPVWTARVVALQRWQLAGLRAACACGRPQLLRRAGGLVAGGEVLWWAWCERRWQSVAGGLRAPEAWRSILSATLRSSVAPSLSGPRPAWRRSA
jgi:hypothetical protein